MLYGNRCVQVFGKPLSYFVNNKVLKKACLHEDPQRQYENQDAQQNFQEYIRNLFQGKIN